MMKLRDDYGIWLDGHEMIAEQFVKDYMSRFNSSHITNKTLLDLRLSKLVSSHENNKLTKRSNLAKVKEAIFSIDSHKTLGPNRFGVELLRLVYSQKDLCNYILEFFTKGRLLKEMNHTFIAHILKVTTPTQVAHYWPINMYSTIYKIISKILIN